MFLLGIRFTLSGVKLTLWKKREISRQYIDLIWNENWPYSHRLKNQGSRLTSSGVKLTHSKTSEFLGIRLTTSKVKLNSFVKIGWNCLAVDWLYLELNSLYQKQSNFKSLDWLYRKSNWPSPNRLKNQGVRLISSEVTLTSSNRDEISWHYIDLIQSQIELTKIDWKFMASDLIGSQIDPINDIKNF